MNVMAYDRNASRLGKHVERTHPKQERRSQSIQVPNQHINHSQSNRTKNLMTKSAVPRGTNINTIHQEKRSDALSNSPISTASTVCWQTSVSGETNLPIETVWG
jgi:SET domain-containing protein